MKKFTLSIFALFCVANLFAQEIQLHFDPRHGLQPDFAPRNYCTATLQMFKPDKWGSTFGFVDIDFSQSRGNIGLMYTEIYRNFNFGKKTPIMAHIEFNGGVGKGFSIPNAYLAGASFVHSFSKDIHVETYLAYKYNAFEKVSNDAQWTGVWNTNLCDGKVSLNGFIDVWSENKNRVADDGGKKVILLAEPQFWYNLDKNFSVGSEIEISSNFYGTEAYIFPTLAVKWSIN